MDSGGGSRQASTVWASTAAMDDMVQTGACVAVWEARERLDPRDWTGLAHLRADRMRLGSRPDAESRGKKRVRRRAVAAKACEHQQRSNE